MSKIYGKIFHWCYVLLSIVYTALRKPISTP
jgi:hypothetical protein